MKERLLRAKSMEHLINIIHDASRVTEEETKSYNFIDDQPTKISINMKSWANWKPLSDKLRNKFR